LEFVGLPLIPLVVATSEMQPFYLVMSSGKNELVSMVAQSIAK